LKTTFYSNIIRKNFAVILVIEFIQIRHLRGYRISVF
jgi:hypothetical protein